MTHKGIWFSVFSPAFRQGFKAVLPLWVAAAPFALAYVIAAQKAGLNAFETQIMSLTVYSAAAQLAATQFLTSGISVVAMLMSVVVMHLHHILYGLSLTRHMPLSRIERGLGAYFLNDGAYGVTVSAENRLNFDFLFGAELSMFVAWNLFTAIGLLIGGLVVLPTWMSLDFIVPLTFLVLLISRLKTWLEAGIVILSALFTLGCFALQMGNLTLIFVGIGGALIGAWIAQQWDINNQKQEDL